MPKSDNQKLKIFYILDYLQKNSQQDKPVGAQELISMLDRQHNISCDRKTVYSDIKALQDYVSESDKMKPVSLIHMSYYQGIEAAMNAGRDLAVGDFVYEFDYAFTDYEPELVYRVYERMLEGYDVVAAAPKKHIPLSSKL